MNRVAIRELRADLSNHVKRAAGGESFVITIDGKPTAVISGFVADLGKMTIDEMVAAGRLIPGPAVDSPRPPRRRGLKGGRPTDEVMDEIREEKI